MAGQLVLKPSNLKYRYSLDGGSNWVVLPHVQSFTPGSPEADEVEVTDFDSADDYKEYRNGLTDPGSATVGVHWVIGDTAQEGLRAMVGDPTVVQFQAIAQDDADTPNIETETISCLVKACTRQAVEVGGKLMNVFTLRQTGKSAFTATDPTA